MRLVSESTDPTVLDFVDDINYLVDEGLIEMRIEDGEPRFYPVEEEEWTLESLA